jgi:hypothetical protein
MRAHINTGHGGRDKMMKELNKKYANITRDVINLYKEMCEECQLKKRKVASKGLVIKPLLSKDFNSRGQVDLVDMQSMRDGNYRFIMHYQDHLTKFSVLRALTSKQAAEVAFQLLDIFLLFGAPHILQSDNGREFTANVVKELTEMWPECTLVHGKPRHPQSQGSVERGNADIKDMLIIWMRENNNKSWNIGLKFVQFKKNNSHHTGINRSPYKAMFGCDAKVGLASSSLPHDILSALQSEEDLEQHLQGPATPDAIVEPPENQTDGNENDPEEIDIYICTVCNKSCFGNASCSVCGKIVHELCASVETDKVTCHHCLTEQTITVERNEASESMRRQASRMRSRSEKILTEVAIGDNVLIPIPNVDRGRGDPRNVMAVILSEEEHGYRLGTKGGVLRGLYTRNQFELSHGKFITNTDVNADTEISLRQAVSNASVCDGQGFIRCGCSASGKKRCYTKRCMCKKSGLICNSRCHPNIDCCNK